MPTIVEILEHTVRALQKGLECKCDLCDGTGTRKETRLVEVPCPHCKAEGHIGGAGFVMRCSFCRGSRKAMQPEEHEVDCGCNGGVWRVSAFHPQVACGALAAAVSQMHDARERDDYDTLNAVLDWAQVYIAASIADEVKRAKEDPVVRENTSKLIDEIQASFADEYERRSQLVGGALTQEELDELMAEEGE